MALNRIIALSDLKSDQQGRIVTVGTAISTELQSLLRAGIKPNACVSVVQRDGWHILFFADSRELAVDREIASEIYVKPNK